MKKNKVITKTLIIILVIAVILGIGVIALYYTTDFFKTDKQLFEEQISKDITKLNMIMDLTQEKEYINNLREENYEEQSSIKINYTNTQGQSELFSGTISGSTDNENKVSYRDIKINYGETESNIFNVEFLKENNLYGIRFSDLVGQYVSINTNQMDQLLKNANINKEDIKIDEGLKILLEIESKKKSIQQICFNMIQQANETQYTKQKDKMLTLSNGKSITTEAYILKFTEEQTKKMCTDILKHIKQEDLASQIQNINEFGNLTITLYVSERDTVRAELEFNQISLKLDLYENDINIKYNNTSSIEAINLEITKNVDKNIIEYSDNKNKLYIEYNISGNKCIVTLKITNNQLKEMQVSIEQSIKSMNNVSIDKTFANEKNVLLNNLDIDTLNSAMGSLLNRINNKLIIVQNETNSEIIRNIAEQTKQIQSQFEKTKQEEKDKFNNQFELYKGENIEQNVILNMLDIAGKNMTSYQVIGENTIKIYLKQDNENTQMAEEIKNNLEEKDITYNVKFDYDEDGKISIITMEEYIEKEE